MTPTEFKDYLLAFLVFAFRLLVILAAAALIGSMFVSVSAAVECKSTHDRKTYWSYRIIDGERCWYRGHRILPKSQLHWPDDNDQPKKRRMQDPIFTHHAEATRAKTVAPDEFNELDAQAGNAEPFRMFPRELTDKITRWWDNIWEPRR